MKSILDQLQTFFSEEPTLDEIKLVGAKAMIFFYRNRQEVKPSLFSNQNLFLDWLFEFTECLDIRLDPLHPINGGQINGTGLRWHAATPPVCFPEAIFCLRKHRFETISLESFGDPRRLMPKIFDIVDKSKPMLICGASGAGKTSLLMCLLQRFCYDENLIFFEKNAELSFDNPRWTSLQEQLSSLEGKGGFSLSQLFSESLRLRPDRLIFSEIRAHEISLLVNALHSGHRGLMGTMHAGSVDQALRRINRLDEFKTTNEELIGLHFCYMSKEGPTPTINELGVLEPTGLSSACRLRLFSQEKRQKTA